MFKTIVQKVVTALVIVAMLITSTVTLANAAALQTPAVQQLRSKTVTGTLPGGQFAKFWLGLEPEQSGSDISIIAEWDRNDPTSNGVGFFVLDQERLARVGDESLSSLALAAGTANTLPEDPRTNVQRAAFNAVGFSKYTLVMVNDSGTAATFKVTVTGGLIIDDSKQVTDPNAQPVTTTEPAQSNAPAPAASQPITATATPAPIATKAPVSATTATTTATTTVSAPAPTGAPKVVRGREFQGELATQDSQHFLGLVPDERDGEITLHLTFDPQDSGELARRLNFWVLDSAGLTQFLAGSSLSEVAIAAGNRTFREDNNERVASFKASNFGPYTTIVENKSRVPATYKLTVEGGLLSDDSGQTKTAQAAGGSAANVAATTTTTTTTGTTNTGTTATTAAPAANTAASAGTAGADKPGGTHTVKSGESLSTIARDLYGDLNLYKAICTFNGISNCDVIEVGDVIKLPTLDQAKTGATAPATAAAKPTPAPTKAPTKPATSTTLTTTRSITPTTAVTTTKLSTTPTVTNTTAVTNTPNVSSTNATTGTAITANDNLVDILSADGRFTSLVKALKATGLDSVLKGRGPFTIFAPTDAAFAALPKGAFEQLLADPGGQLKDILLYHVVSSKTMAADISNNLQATTLQGKPVKFAVKDGGVRINSAGIIETDIEGSNGVIHVIDTVILPPAR